MEAIKIEGQGNLLTDRHMCDVTGDTDGDGVELIHCHIGKSVGAEALDDLDGSAKMPPLLAHQRNVLGAKTKVRHDSASAIWVTGP